ncbi:MAG: glycosyltransferase family 1 protein [Candidatus Sericytochromatia bacterium]|nr:glycosyltransferase family 1 protein [Candidatus Tanganyikabacteria bacterium]
MKVVVAGVGSRGDMQPLFALALALRERGHEVAMAGPPDFTAWAAGLGLPYREMGASFEANVRDVQELAERRPLAALTLPVVAELLAAQFAVVEEACRGADLLVGNGALPAGPSVARAAGIPCFLAILQPTWVRNDAFPPIFVSWQRLPRWARSIAWGVFSATFDTVFGRQVNRGRKRLGLPPIRGFTTHLRAEAHLLMAFDPAVAGPLPDWDLPHTVTGYWWLDDPAPLPPDLAAFLAAGPPPVYVGFGSMTAKDAVARTKLIVAAAETAGVRAVISAGWAGLGRDVALPATCLAIGAVPHADLFPRCAAIVHHGGAGTTAAAARSGRPQVVVCHVLDQYFWGFQVRQRGIAPEPIPIGKLTAPRLAAAIEEACADPALAARAAATGEALRARDGLAEAVALLEAVHRPTEPVVR